MRRFSVATALLIWAGGLCSASAQDTNKPVGENAVPPELCCEWQQQGGRRIFKVRVRNGLVEFHFLGRQAALIKGTWARPVFTGKVSLVFPTRVRRICPGWRKARYVPIRLTLSGDGARLVGSFRGIKVVTQTNIPSKKLCDINGYFRATVTLKRASEGKGRIRLTVAAGGLLSPSRIALILDASGSMGGRLPEGASKIDVAKRVMRSVIRALPARAMIGLRVYGHRYRSRPKRRSCLDSQLVVPFGRDNRDQLISAIARLRPRGQTPIGLSLSRLAEDFGGATGFKLVVLVSDGIETCAPSPRDRYHPIKVVRQLQARGLKLRVNVIGFDVGRSKTQAFLKQIAKQGGGVYFGATNARQLEKVLKHAFAISYVVYNYAGRVLAKGSVGGPAVELVAGTYRVVISGASTLTVNNVNVRNGRETLLRVTRKDGKNQVERSTR